MKLHINFPVATSINCIAIVGHNLEDTATINLHAGSSFDPSHLVTLTWRKNIIFHVFDSAQNYKYWTINVSDVANQHGFFQVGYIVMGNLTEMNFGFAVGADFTDTSYDEFSHNEFTVPIPKHKSEQMKLRLLFQNKPVSEMNVLKNLFLDNLGVGKPALFIPDTSGRDCVFGRITHETFNKVFSTYTLSTTALEIEDDYPGIVNIPAYPIIEAGSPIWPDFYFDRDSTAFYKNSDLKLVSATSDELRELHYWDAYRYGILLEPERTNVVLNSETFTGWGLVRATILANDTNEPKADPEGSANKLQEDNTIGTHYIYSANNTIIADSDHGLSIFVKADERYRGRFSLWRSGVEAGVRFDLVSETLTDYVVGTGSVTASALEKYGDDWYRILVDADLGGGLTTGRVFLFLEDSAGNTTYTGTAGYGMYAWGAQLESNAEFPSSYIKTETSTATRQADTLRWDWLGTRPEPVTFYCKYINIGNSLQGYEYGIMKIGDTAAVASIFELRPENGFIHYTSIDGSSVSSSSGASLPPAEIECLGHVYSDGSVKLGIKNASGSFGYGSQSAALAWGVWPSAPVFMLGARRQDVSPAHALILIEAAKIYRGEQSLDFMRRLKP
jgi:hypothetical protein